MPVDTNHLKHPCRLSTTPPALAHPDEISPPVGMSSATPQKPLRSSARKSFRRQHGLVLFQMQTWLSYMANPNNDDPWSSWVLLFLKQCLGGFYRPHPHEDHDRGFIHTCLVWLWLIISKMDEYPLYILLTPNKDCGLSSVTGSWFLERETDVEFVLLALWTPQDKCNLVPLYLRKGRHPYSQYPQTEQLTSRATCI